MYVNKVFTLNKYFDHDIYLWYKSHNVTQNSIYTPNSMTSQGPGATKLKYSENKNILRMNIFTQLRINLLFSATKLFSQI